MSRWPYGPAPAGWVPTSLVTDVEKVARSGVGGSLPHAKRRPSVPRAAFSNSASVGSRLPTMAQYARASFHEMLEIGCRGPRNLRSGPTWLRSALRGDGGLHLPA